MVKGHLIEGEAGIDSVEGDWRRLAERRGNPFVTPDWYRANLVAGRQPKIVVVGDAAGVIGLMPLVLERGLGRLRLRFAGHELGDRFHPVAALEREPEVTGSALETLRHAGWKRGLVLDKCDDESGWLSHTYRGGALGAERLHVASRAQLPRIRLGDGDWDRYLASRSSNLRQRLRRMERKLIRDHGMEIRATATPGDLDTDFDTMFDLHDARRAERGGTSLGSESKRSALRRFCHAAFERGWLRLRIMECNGDPVAAFLGWRLGDTYSFYQSGFDPEWGRLSVGLVMLGLTVREAIEEGVNVFDLLLGEEQYKQRFADASCEVISGFLGPGLSQGAALAHSECTGRAARERIRQWRRRSSS